jgi:enoyl-[acyl-carrier protein] reductase I
MDGKKGLVIGIANNRSIAWSIAQKLYECNATLGFTYLNDSTKKRVEDLSKKVNVDFIEKCDVKDESQIKNVCIEFGKKYGSIDFIVHSIAYADSQELENGVLNTTKEGFLNSLEITAYSIIPFCRYSKEFFREGSSIITLSYLGADRVCVGYGLMGIAKAALQSTCRYLAEDLGPLGVRVNAISAGPLRTAAAFGLPNFKEMLAKKASMSPLRKSTTHDQVASTALFLLNDLSSGITGETIYVDAGYNIMGTWKD